MDPLVAHGCPCPNRCPLRLAGGRSLHGISEDSMLLLLVFLNHHAVHIRCIGEGQRHDVAQRHTHGGQNVGATITPADPLPKLSIASEGGRIDETCPQTQSDAKPCMHPHHCADSNFHMLNQHTRACTHLYTPSGVGAMSNKRLPFRPTEPWYTRCSSVCVSVSGALGCELYHH